MKEIFWIFVSVIVGILFFVIGKKIGGLIERQKFKKQLVIERKQAVEKSRSVLSGKFSEQIAPYFPDFPYNPSESRFIGSPVDFIVFKGMDGKKIEEIVFVEVKTGSAKLNVQEQNLKQAVLNKKIKWFEYRRKD